MEESLRRVFPWQGGRIWELVLRVRLEGLDVVV
jgi:hypothetical protein